MEVMVGEMRGREREGRLEMVNRLEEENKMLKKENEMLLNTVKQMDITLNRFIKRYVAGKTGQ